MLSLAWLIRFIVFMLFSVVVRIAEFVNGEAATTNSQSGSLMRLSLQWTFVYLLPAMAFMYVRRVVELHQHNKKNAFWYNESADMAFTWHSVIFAYVITHIGTHTLHTHTYTHTQHTRFGTMNLPMWVHMAFSYLCAYTHPHTHIHTQTHTYARVLV